MLKIHVIIDCNKVEYTGITSFGVLSDYFAFDYGPSSFEWSIFGVCIYNKKKLTTIKPELV